MTAIDLFAGSGGLSLGLRKAGFEISCALEINQRIAETYKKNHPKTKILIKDITQVSGKDILKLCGQRPNLIVGCAPCQGFCSLTRKYKRHDPRNELLTEMARIIEELRPDAFMMENVPGLVTRGKDIFNEFINRMDRLGYQANWRVVQMANYGVPQSRRRLVMIAGRGFTISLPEPTHHRTPKQGSELKPWVTVRETIKGMGRPVTLSKAQTSNGPQAFNWHVVSDLLPRTKARLKAAMPGVAWNTIPEQLRPKCHRGEYKGFSNVYGRMKWDNVSVAITRGCTTPSMGRFGHPDRRRYALSVREAARLQTFPDSYKFATDHKNVVCDMIGNAVPPIFARLLSEKIREALEIHRGEMAG